MHRSFKTLEDNLNTVKMEMRVLKDRDEGWEARGEGWLENLYKRIGGREKDERRFFSKVT